MTDTTSANDAALRVGTPEIDIESIRAKYAAERDRRIRPDGNAQYNRLTGELAEYAADPYTPLIEREPVSDVVDVLIIGAGIGGLTTAARLRASGLQSVRLMDQAGDFGGTWYWNRYPGIKCDIESHVYMPLLEETGTVPSWRYAPGEEIRRHLVALAERYDLYRDALLHTRAVKATWTDGRWNIETDRGDAFSAKYIVVSAGGVNTPKFPGIEGIDKFQGRMFHTSRWDYSYTGGDQFGGLTGLTDKRVAVVGTGATGVQVIPEIAKYAQHLYVFQRTPALVAPRDNRPTTEDWIADRGPGWQHRRMENFLQITSGGTPETDMVDDEWTRKAKFLNKQNTGTWSGDLNDPEQELHEEIEDALAMDAIRARVDDIVTDPATAELLKPWFRYFCKRPTFSDLYLPAFNRDNVTLVDTANFGGVSRITENSIVVGDNEYPVDLIVFATGFEVGTSSLMTGEFDVVGRGGKRFLEAWQYGPRTLHGYLTAGFPNLFHLGVIHSANNINFSHMLQIHAEHVADVIGRIETAGAGGVEPTPEMEDQWAAEIEATARNLHDYHATCTPGYFNAEGKPMNGGITYGPGPIVFREALSHWRETSLDDAVFAPES
ncbi:NAD(P)/FAD-dependent oxidoreductase [Rhodococcus sp. SORGH_AS_0301]|uniref:flavin-containing monooxygenase n=1 Tax=Rhodococcus sp. SORGH_AS_0301 TaxID=3041780 RepID=UPI00278857C6|nr:NAD(P)/FAD-dependent oxidoreductase [Rhodococcus sp. SORGH_AS_0301]MDQ1178583.1 cation diffusion facilitator CzcD-associated flavoprotein CzcO [Rhodococcus sp. SORGH_AS_0301]